MSDTQKALGALENIKWRLSVYFNIDLESTEDAVERLMNDCETIRKALSQDQSGDGWLVDMARQIQKEYEEIPINRREFIEQFITQPPIQGDKR